MRYCCTIGVARAVDDVASALSVVAVVNVAIDVVATDVDVGADAE